MPEWEDRRTLSSSGCPGAAVSAQEFIASNLLFYEKKITLNLFKPFWVLCTSSKMQFLHDMIIFQEP